MSCKNCYMLILQVRNVHCIVFHKWLHFSDGYSNISGEGCGLSSVGKVLYKCKVILLYPFSCFVTSSLSSGLFLPSSLWLLAINLWCGFLSNAFWKTKCTTTTVFLLSVTAVISSKDSRRLVEHNLPCLNLCWLLLIILCSLECSSSLCFIFLLQLTLVKLRMYTWSLHED